jgi:uncharacterized protein involved in type VI secretion and phage assembly
MRGMTIGIVTSLDDPEGQGHVGLKFPGMAGDLRSARARVATPLAGSARGAWLMPEVGDEVLVAFEGGHLEVPYVIGSLWNGVDLPPETDPKHRIIRTPGGHELRFEDTEGAKRVVLTTSAGFTVEMDDSAKTITLKTPGQLSVTLSDADDSVEVRGGGRAVALRGGQLRIT